MNERQRRLRVKTLKMVRELKEAYQYQQLSIREIDWIDHTFERRIRNDESLRVDHLDSFREMIE